jgi:K319-like protein
MSRRLVLSGALLMLVGLLASEGFAQASQPIYLQYDGFVKNKDGTYTLSFGYFNLNHVDVRIEPGSDNSFLPAPGDRNQPVLFVKGRHRFACSVVVPSDFDGKLQWMVRFAGKTYTTTAKALDPLYELELASEKRATSGLDLAMAPKGVCVNRAPSIQVINPQADVNAGADTLAATSFATRLDQEVSLNGSVEDDGLPRESKLTVSWKMLSGPGTVTFSEPSKAITRARFTAVGAYELELSATDNEHSNAVKIKVTVNPPDEKK